MKTLNRKLTALLIGASALAFAAPAHAQVDVSVGGGSGVSADVGATSAGGNEGISADADVNLGDTSADADIRLLDGDRANASVDLGTDDDATASIDANVGDAADGSVDLDLGDIDAGIALDFLAEQAASAGGSDGGIATVVASMSGGQIARYKPTCAEVAGDSKYPAELRELCALILQR